MSRRHRAAAALALLLTLAGGCSAPPDGSGPREKTEGESVTVEVNSKAPAFAARTLDGRQVRLADYLGSHVVLLEFWSIFCKSCIEEMPAIEALHERYAADGLAVLSVNTDVFSARKIAGFMERAGLSPPYPVLRDQRQEIVAAFRVELLPVTVLIDREGWIRLYQEGYAPGDEARFERRLRGLLRSAAGEDVTLAARGGVTAFAPAGAQVVAPGQQLGVLRGTTLDGNPVALEPGRPRLLFFWSLYCKPCREELPALSRLAQRYADAGLTTQAVNVDSARLAARVRRFLEPYPQLPCLLDDPAAAQATLAGDLGVRVTPATVLIDAAGSVLYARAGSADLVELEAKVRAALPGGAL